ncbi:MAG: hypothetical protein GY794_00745, partial [bacterium]|nr:hypothetical protein [bacterium]
LALILTLAAPLQTATQPTATTQPVFTPTALWADIPDTTPLQAATTQPAAQPNEKISPSPTVNVYPTTNVNTPKSEKGFYDWYIVALPAVTGLLGIAVGLWFTSRSETKTLKRVLPGKLHGQLLYCVEVLKQAQKNTVMYNDYSAIIQLHNKAASSPDNVELANAEKKLSPDGDLVMAQHKHCQDASSTLTREAALWIGHVLGTLRQLREIYRKKKRITDCIDRAIDSLGSSSVLQQIRIEASVDSILNTLIKGGQTQAYLDSLQNAEVQRIKEEINAPVQKVLTALTTNK